MTDGKKLIATLVAAVAMAALAAPATSACPRTDLILAADDTGTDMGQTDETDSAKMGKEEGTHTGDAQSATPESDTKKVEQPERRNPTTGD
jgi:hypothetical protein